MEKPPDAHGEATNRRGPLAERGRSAIDAEHTPGAGADVARQPSSAALCRVRERTGYRAHAHGPWRQRARRCLSPSRCDNGARNRRRTRLRRCRPCHRRRRAEAARHEKRRARGTPRRRSVSRDRKERRCRRDGDAGRESGAGAYAPRHLRRRAAAHRRTCAEPAHRIGAARPRCRSGSPRASRPHASRCGCTQLVSVRCAAIRRRRCAPVETWCSDDGRGRDGTRECRLASRDACGRRSVESQ